MLQQSCLFCVVVHTFVALIFLNLFTAANAHLNHHLQTETSAKAAVSSVTTYDDEDSGGGSHLQETWQPIAAHNNNWIMLQTSALTASSDDAGVSASTAITKKYVSPRQHTLTSYTIPAGHTRHPHSQHQQQQIGQHTIIHRLPVNYYAYSQNHSTGNYKPTSGAPSPPTPPTATMKITKDVVVDEPYVLAISKLPPSPRNVVAAAAGIARQHSTTMNMLKRRKIPVPLFVSGSKLPEDIVSNSASNKKSQPDVVQDISNSDGSGGSVKNSYSSRSVGSAAHMKRNNDGVHAHVGTVDVANDVADNDNISADDTKFNEMLLPLESALDKVIHFCDFAKRIISEEQEENGIDELNEIIPTTGPRPDINASGDAGSSGTITSADEVQGRNSASTSLMAKSSSLYDDYSSYSYTDFDLSPFSRGRKVKKFKRKFKKFLLPLLIAYKLKFLTLVPVFIGGLTLLVGATGMAGFFFALFAAVMSLKTSSGGKSVILKRI